MAPPSHIQEDTVAVQITVTPTVHPEILDPEDRNGVAGTYIVTVTQCTGFTVDDVIESAKDCFHNEVPIHTLDHFDIDYAITPPDRPSEAIDARSRVFPRTTL